MFIADRCNGSSSNKEKNELEKIAQLILKSKANIVEKADIENFSFELSGGEFKFLKCAETETEILDFADYIISLKKEKNNHILLSNEEIAELSKKIIASVHNQDIYNLICCEISKEQYL